MISIDLISALDRKELEAGDCERWNNIYRSYGVRFATQGIYCNLMHFMKRQHTKFWVCENPAQHFGDVSLSVWHAISKVGLTGLNCVGWLGNSVMLAVTADWGHSRSRTCGHNIHQVQCCFSTNGECLVFCMTCLVAMCSQINFQHPLGVGFTGHHVIWMLITEIIAGVTTTKIVRIAPTWTLFWRHNWKLKL